MSLKQRLTKPQGFTLIEVVIVLAIAGLIFVIVFLAVGQAQAARRDTQRKNEANRLKAAIDQYSANNNGAVPTSSAQLSIVTGQYVDNLQDPATGDYTVSYSTTAPSDAGAMSYQNNRVCSGTAMTNVGANTRNYAILFWLERGGTQCADNR